MASLQELLSSLSERLGLVLLEPNRDDVYTLVYKNKICLRLREKRAAQEFFLWSDVLDAAPDQLSEAMLRSLLIANFRWACTEGGAFSIQPGSEVVQYARRCSLEGMNEEAFEKMLQEILAAILNMRSLLHASFLVGTSKVKPSVADGLLLKG